MAGNKILILPPATKSLVRQPADATDLALYVHQFGKPVTSILYLNVPVSAMTKDELDSQELSFENEKSTIPC